MVKYFENFKRWKRDASFTQIVTKQSATSRERNSNATQFGRQIYLTCDCSEKYVAEVYFAANIRITSSFFLRIFHFKYVHTAKTLEITRGT